MSLQSASPVNPLLLPPRLMFRALDDLHAIALAAGRLQEVEQSLNARVDALLAMGDRIERIVADGLDLAESIREAGEQIVELGGSVDERAAGILAMGDRIDARAEQIIAMGDRVDGRAEAIIAAGDRIEARGAEVIAMGDRMESRSAEILAQGERVVAAAREVADRGAELAAALPVMQRAVEMAEPLEGIVERLGRVADRLPGARARS